MTFFFPKNRAVYEIMRRNIVVSGRQRMTIWHMRFECWITKATDTNPEYVILRSVIPVVCLSYKVG